MAAQGKLDAGHLGDRDSAPRRVWMHVAAERRGRAGRDRGVIDWFEHAGQRKTAAKPWGRRVDGCSVGRAAAGYLQASLPESTRSHAVKAVCLSVGSALSRERVCSDRHDTIKPIAEQRPLVLFIRRFEDDRSARFAHFS